MRVGIRIARNCRVAAVRIWHLLWLMQHCHGMELMRERAMQLPYLPNSDAKAGKD